MSKKDYFIGLITGVLISAFIGVTVLCVRIVYENDENVQRAERYERTEQIVEEAVKDYSEENTGTTNTDTILNDEEFLNKVMLLEDTIDMYYIDDVEKSVIEEGIYDGIMSSINDPYAAYYTVEELIELTNDTTGIYYGIGAYLQKDQEFLYPRITGLIDNSPAAESILRVDDIIVAVDGQNVYDTELTDVVSLIRGEEGTYVTLSIVRRATGEEFDVQIQRRQVESPTVNYEMYDSNIAYIQIKEFDIVTVDQFKEAYNQAIADGMKGLILDLRGNPGGSLSAVVEIADYFLPKGLVVYTEDKYGQRDEYRSSGYNEINVPMVVLVDGGSASASEILAGAIKDYGKGILLGTTTYGKGIVQRIIPFSDGSAVKLTISHYYTPLGNDIHQIGIEPDEVLEFDIDAYLEDINNDNQLDRALEILREETK